LLCAAVVVSRSSCADTQRHRNAIGEAGRKASTDAYNATARFDGQKPIHVIEASTIAYGYRFCPPLAVEQVLRAVEAHELQGYAVVVVTDGFTMPKYRRTYVSLLNLCNAYFCAANTTTPQQTPGRGAAAPQATGACDGAVSGAAGDNAAPDPAGCRARAADEASCYGVFLRLLAVEMQKKFSAKYKHFDDATVLLRNLAEGERGVFLMVS